jgi:hypothetical protein
MNYTDNKAQGRTPNDAVSIVNMGDCGRANLTMNQMQLRGLIQGGRLVEGEITQGYLKQDGQVFGPGCRFESGQCVHNPAAVTAQPQAPATPQEAPKPLKLTVWMPALPLTLQLENNAAARIDTASQLLTVKMNHNTKLKGNFQGAQLDVNLHGNAKVNLKGSSAQTHTINLQAFDNSGFNSCFVPSLVVDCRLDKNAQAFFGSEQAIESMGSLIGDIRKNASLKLYSNVQGIDLAVKNNATALVLTSAHKFIFEAEHTTMEPR